MRAGTYALGAGGAVGLLGLLLGRKRPQLGSFMTGLAGVVAVAGAASLAIDEGDFNAATSARR